MNEKVAGRKSVLPIPDEHGDQEKGNYQQHYWKSRFSKVLAAWSMPDAEGHKRYQLERAGVFREDAQADEQAGDKPPPKRCLVFRLPERLCRKCPEEDVHGVDGHECRTDSEQWSYGR